MQAKVLVLAEHDKQGLKTQTAQVLSAAQHLSKDITGIVLGENCRAVAEQLAMLEPITQVYLSEAPFFAEGLAEELAHFLAGLAKSFDYILAPATTYGKNILPRLAGILELGQISDVIQIVSHDTFIRPMYAGNVLCSVQACDPIKLLTIRPTAFEAVKPKTSSAPIEVLPAGQELKLSSFVSLTHNEASRPDLGVAKIVISGGRGLQSRENFKMLEEIADKLSAAIGASRAAVDAGFVPNEVQVGQTGKVVAPELYIAVGISGAIQHISGMKDSKVIVAINKDPDAPIFQVADYGLVGDLFQILPELNRELATLKH